MWVTLPAGAAPGASLALPRSARATTPATLRAATRTLEVNGRAATVLGLDPAAWIAGNAARIGHVHIADHPGRHEPGTGTIDFPAVLSALRAAGYAGAVGFEYLPTRPTPETVGFLPDWKRRLAAPALTGAPS